TGLVEFGDGTRQNLSFVDFSKTDSGLASTVSHLYRKKGDYNLNVDIALTEIPLFLPGRLVVVTENSKMSRNKIRKLAKKLKLETLETFDVEPLGQTVFQFETQKDVLQGVSEFKKEPFVVLAQPNFILRTRSEPGIRLQRLNRELHLETLHRNVVGQGVSVAVIDTGVDTTHEDLKERVTLSKNMLVDDPFKPEIHGTAVAGIIGASLNQFGILGIAPKVNLLAYRACSQIEDGKPEGICYSTAVAKALSHALAHGAQIINMSFGIGTFDQLIDKILAKGAKKGALLVAPVGNRPWQKEVSFPASHPKVLAVGGLNDSQQPYPNAEVVKGTQVLAPATSIFTTIPGNRHSFIDGTSMASAAVSGLLAAALEGDQEFNFKRIPVFKKQFCSWESRLLNMELCSRERVLSQ
ncbi:MAG: S8 family serine peptidase, partial [Nitrospinota bacterium]